MSVKNAELLPLFREVKALLEPYAKRYVVRHDEPGYFDLHTPEAVAFEGHRKRETLFAAAIIQKRYVGLYATLAYVRPDLFGDELLGRLKGKSCFYLTELSPEIRAQIADALRRGDELYREEGWV